MKNVFLSSHLVFALLIESIAVADETPLVSQERKNYWAYSLYFENDLFADTDQQYTNGAKIGIVSPDLKEFATRHFPETTKFVAGQFPFLKGDEVSRNVAFSIGQNMYTPEGIVTTELVEDDRPYAAWLYFGAGFHLKTDKYQNSAEIQLGMVGSSALGKEFQDFVHDRRGIARANGWANQLKNEIGLNIVAEHRRRFGPDPGEIKTGWGVDAIGNAGLVIGNVSTYANLGIEGRFGYNLPSDFGTTHIRPGAETNIPTLGINRQTEKDYFIHLFASVDGRVVARDIFLDGNTFRDSHSVSKEPLVADLAFGFKFKLRRLKISVSQVRRSKQFKLQPDSHTFGSFMVSYSH